MRRLVPFLIVPLLACSGGEDPKEDSGDAAVDYGPNPIVPEEYELLWDLNAESCEEHGAIVYFRFQGSIDAAGNLTGEESWYWFHSGEGWEGDCVDVFTVDMDEGGLNWGQDCGNACDREFLGTWTLDEAQRTCSYGYENLFDDDDTDRIDDEAYVVDVMLDTLTPSGNVNEDMIVFSFVQDDQSESSYNGRTNGRGSYTPDGTDYITDPATLEWVGQSALCVTF